jgi:hypothetical protein
MSQIQGVGKRGEEAYMNYGDEHAGPHNEVDGAYRRGSKRKSRLTWRPVSI